MESTKCVSNELKKYFSNNAFFRKLLPLDLVFAFGGVGIMLINLFVNTGGLLSAVAYYAFLFGILLTFANQNHKYLYGSLFVYAGINGFEFIKYALFQSYRFIDYGGLLACVIFGFLGYRAYENYLRK
jgi:hypothetical protein